MSTPEAKRNEGLIEMAESALADHPDSDIEAALEFLKDVVPAFCKESNDRLVKVGRSLRSLVSLKDEIPLQESIALLIQECEILIQPDIKVPKVRFGKTELAMPIVSLGCMRFQQQWGDKVSNINMVNSDCQDNLVAVLKQALAYGITHIETARGYGSSELQLGVALKQLFMTGQAKREDFIIQTKVNANADPQIFRSTLEKSFKNLQVDYVDLFAFHGFNGEFQWDWVFGGEDNCWNVIQEYKDAGKIRHVGFSTHASTEFICKAIKTNKFDYVNQHHHFCGSYTASGDGTGGIGNLECLRLMKERDMGAFVISIADKGGKVYAPSRKLRSLTLPDMEPMAYGAAAMWNLHEMDAEKASVHTFSVGAARPADLDQFAVAAYSQGKGELLSKTKAIKARLDKAMIDTLGQDWVDTCYQGLVPCTKSKYGIQHNQMISFYNNINAWGLHQYSKDRFKTFEDSSKKADPALSVQENIEKIGLISWGYMPGFLPEVGKDYFVDDLAGVPEKNRARVKEAYEFVHKWCNSGKGGEAPPKEWATAYEMKPWKDFPERPYP